MNNQQPFSPRSLSPSQKNFRRRRPYLARFMAPSLCLAFRSGGSYRCRCSIVSGRENLVGGYKRTLDYVLALVYVSYVPRLVGNVLPSEWWGIAISNGFFFFFSILPTITLCVRLNLGLMRLLSLWRICTEVLVGVVRSLLFMLIYSNYI